MHALTYVYSRSHDETEELRNANSDVEERVRPQPPSKKKKTGPVSFIENYDSRAQKARRSGRKIENDVSPCVFARFPN